MGAPDMAPQFTWGPRHGPQAPSARHAPGNPGRSSVLRAGGSPLHGLRPAEWNAVIPEHPPTLRAPAEPWHFASVVVTYGAPRVRIRPARGAPGGRAGDPADR